MAGAEPLGTCHDFVRLPFGKTEKAKGKYIYEALLKSSVQYINQTRKAYQTPPKHAYHLQF
jgi:hypothetical protein